MCLTQICSYRPNKFPPMHNFSLLCMLILWSFMTSHFQYCPALMLSNFKSMSSVQFAAAIISTALVVLVCLFTTSIVLSLFSASNATLSQNPSSSLGKVAARKCWNTAVICILTFPPSSCKKSHLRLGFN